MVDFFIHDANGAQILIQMWNLFYRDHKAKYGPEDEDMEHHLLNPSPEARLQYIYLTPNISFMA